MQPGMNQSMTTRNGSNFMVVIAVRTLGCENNGTASRKHYAVLDTPMQAHNCVLCSIAGGLTCIGMMPVQMNSLLPQVPASISHSSTMHSTKYAITPDRSHNCNTVLFLAALYNMQNLYSEQHYRCYTLHASKVKYTVRFMTALYGMQSMYSDQHQQCQTLHRPHLKGKVHSAFF